MNKVHVKKNDTVVVLSGKDSGKKGKILKVITEDMKVLVEGVNISKRHTRPRPPKIPQGGILEKAQPMSSSNVQLVCPKCSKPTRIAHKQSSEGKNERVCKQCGEVI
ncbi:MAG: 50S ribosomal protein L24 [bacterium]